MRRFTKNYFSPPQIFFLSLVVVMACNSKSTPYQQVDTDFDSVLTIEGPPDFSQASYITTDSEAGNFALSANGKTPDILISKDDYAGVLRISEHLKTDLTIVTGNEVEIIRDQSNANSRIIIIGTLGKSPIIKKLIDDGKIDLSDLDGRWEQFFIEVVDNPFEGISKALVVAGSDKRGTIYGMYDLSASIGVSPWYWWADVPVKTHPTLYIKPGRHTNGEPAVKYRGIFINDEAPALSGWATEKFGGFNHQFYEKVYELILRLNGNYLWPAMWGRSLFDDDSLSAPLADEYGIVIGTTHHEPMMRSHVEWNRYGNGPWNYEKNEENLKAFWRKGLERMGNYESTVTVGMRGDGDEAMSEQSNIALLQKIVKDQRAIIEEVTGKPAAEIPQLWALYKEVQDYYNKGMRVPEDVTLLLCDDNWGNIRVLPRPDDRPRKGGYGIYYHFDFVGGPRNYKWLNTSPISRVWEQMNLAYRHGVDRIWLVNVGDLKPMELPISFFLDFAWNPDLIPPEDIPAYHVQWATQQFGPKHAKEIAEILMKYTKWNGRRKPEMLAPDTYSLVNYREAESVMNEYNALAEKAQQVYELLPDELKNAYYQLVLYPVLACANLNELHISTGLNHLYSSQGRVAANAMAKRIEELFQKDKALSSHFHDSLANGKWNHIMSQTHISYTYWQQPEKDVLPELKKVRPAKKAAMGVAIEGSEQWWPNAPTPAILAGFHVYDQQKRYIEIFNRGLEPFNYKIETDNLWLKFSNNTGTVAEQERIWLEVNWDDVPTGIHQSSIKIIGPDDVEVEVLAEVSKPKFPEGDLLEGYVEGNGYVSVEAANFTNRIDNAAIKWKIIPDLGRTGSSMTTFPVSHSRIAPGEDSPRLEYKINLHSSGNARVLVYIAPTLNIYANEGLKYGISFDDEAPMIVNIHEGDTIPDWNYPAWWNNAVSQNIKIMASEHYIDQPGEHSLKYWAVDPAIVIQKIVIVTQGIKPSYLGPPESYYRPLK